MHASRELCQLKVVNWFAFIGRKRLAIDANSIELMLSSYLIDSMALIVSIRYYLWHRFYAVIGREKEK